MGIRARRHRPQAEIPPEDRELVRAKLEEALDARWSGYVTKVLANAEPAA
jgi:hypothetical protein